MSKAVLLSIQPKWCELIASGKKTVEVRKTKPKLEIPFKVYIYCTHSKNGNAYCKGNNIMNGKVIGEFVCDEIKKGTLTVSDLYDSIDIGCNETCLRVSDIKAYLGMKYVEKKGNYTFYGWHISNLIIYDKPKELGEFYKYTEYDDSSKDIRPCHFCVHNKYDWSEMCEYCEIDFDGEHCIHLQMRRPPQSWCYVEGEEGADNA